jgi:hypothetical protein
MIGNPSGTLVEDIALEIRVVMEHSDECFETYGRLPCVCSVGRAVAIVESYADDARNGAVQVD